jgi:hypothetical protein
MGGDYTGESENVPREREGFHKFCTVPLVSPLVAHARPSYSFGGGTQNSRRITSELR